MSTKSAGPSVAGASVAGASVAGASVAGASVAGASVAGASVSEDELTKIKKDLEKKGEAALQALYQEKGVNGSSIGSVVGSLSNGVITEQSLTSIMQKGFDEFKATTGRSMTYGEMRELYG